MYQYINKMSTFRGVVQRVAEGEKIPVASVETLPVDSLPEGKSLRVSRIWEENSLTILGEVLISVQFSGVNYKDGLFSLATF